MASRRAALWRTAGAEIPESDSRFKGKDRKPLPGQPPHDRQGPANSFGHNDVVAK